MSDYTEDRVRSIARDELHNLLESMLDKLAGQPMAKASTDRYDNTPKMEHHNANVIDEFPDDIVTKLNIEPDNGRSLWIVKPKEFLGNETFAKVAGIVKKLGGTYISGKGAHFEVPF